MGFSYLAPDFNTSIVGQVGNSTLTKDEVKQMWFNRFRSNFSLVVPASATTVAQKQKFWEQGYALESETITEDSPPGGDLFSVEASKPLPKSFGKRWKERHKSGEILLTDWEAFEAHFARKGVPVMVPSPNTREEYKGYWFYDFDFNVLAGAALTQAIMKRKPFFSIYLSYRFQYVGNYEYISSIAFPNEKVIKILSPLMVLDNACITSALAEANNGYFDVLTEVAELPETLKWAYDLINQAKLATKAAKDREIKLHRNFRKKLMTAVEFATALSSVWLQYRYAIKPLAYSLADIQTVLMFYEHLFKTARNYESYHDEWVSSIKERAKSLGLHVEYSIDESKFRVFIKRRYNAASVLQDRLRNFSVNPFATAWELVPLSFVADWFVNVGDVLAAGTSLVAYAQESATASWKSAGQFTFTDPNNPGPSIDVSYSSYKRQIINPSAHIELNWDPYVDLVRQLDAIALAWTFSKDEWTKILRKK